MAPRPRYRAKHSSVAEIAPTGPSDPASDGRRKAWPRHVEAAGVVSKPPALCRLRVLSSGPRLSARGAACAALALARARVLVRLVRLALIAVDSRASAH